jgi:hypothetical protein
MTEPHRDVLGSMGGQRLTDVRLPVAIDGELRLNEQRRDNIEINGGLQERCRAALR